jgi:hypothetical protein
LKGPAKKRKILKKIGQNCRKSSIVPQKNENKIKFKLPSGVSVHKDYCQNSEIFRLGLLKPPLPTPHSFFF